ncbi:hypothetical protein IP86_03010 [Rhodopseudomonas sp. AAP120]|uniref:portal protein n=1 Tax=Rhodopseudomonas sp. AAP120 TaxID=1523430 RepID=UPI0006B96521|nr:portal protein [Rhodopseudomonas sp. AAP120]KPG01794.1 hypothetical protein IP86_03010 [Rhodopseudomonas sp. AAP120]
MSEASAEVLKAHDKLRERRRREEPVWRDLARMLRPDDQDFSSAERVDGRSAKRDLSDAELFDSTPLYALDDFAKGLFKQASNPANRWFEITIANPDLAKYRPVKDWCHTVTNIIYASLGPSVSRYYTQVMPWFGNLGAFGFGVLYSQEDIGRQRIIDRSLPIGQMYLDVDAEGEYNTAHREFKLRGNQIKSKFGDRVRRLTLDDDKSYSLVHSVRPNLDYRPGMIGPRGMSYLSSYVSPDLKEMRLDDGYYEFPFFIPVWNERDGSPYPTGPGHMVRADAAMLQEQERSHIVAAQFAAEPPILLDENSMLTAADIVPNAALHGGMSEQGKRLVEVLERKQQPVLSLQLSEQRRNAIRNAFLFSVLQLLNRPQMTATEFNGFSQQQLEQAAPNLVNIQTGGLTPFIQRRYQILSRAGQLPPAPPELNGQRIDIDYVSPLAKAQKIGSARSALSFAQSVIGLSEAFPEARDNVDIDEVVRLMHDGMTDNPALIRDPRAVAQAREARGQQQRAMMQMQLAEQAGGVMADVAHARQAATLADGRGGK